MKIVIAGGTGFIGEPLARRLANKHQVLILTRNPSKVRVGRPVQWRPGGTEWESQIADADGIVNLAGENIGEGRWTEERKQALRRSRLEATGALVSAMRKNPRPGRVLVSASAIGFYGPRGDESLDESASPGHDFLANLTGEWETAAREAESVARVAILRFGIVLAADGGALKKMLLPFRMFAGGPLGSGQQWMSWVDRDDVLGMIEWALERDSVRGTYNTTAPGPVRNREFTGELGRALNRPAIVPAPAFALRALFGEMADPLLLTGQRVLPDRARREGFEFRYPDLPSSLKHAIGGS